MTKTHQDYGLSLVLGGCEVSLWELCALYRGLGTLGRFTDLHVLKLPKGKDLPGMHS